MPFSLEHDRSMFMHPSAHLDIASWRHRDRTEARELAHRESGGLEVSLVWDPTDDALTVVVIDWRTGEAFDFSPERRRALDAFYHPFAHALASC